MYLHGRVKFMCLCNYRKPVDFGLRTCEFYSDYCIGRYHPRGNSLVIRKAVEYEQEL